LGIYHRVRRTRSTLIVFATISVLSLSILASEPPTITISKRDKNNLAVPPLDGGDRGYKAAIKPQT